METRVFLLDAIKKLINDRNEECSGGFQLGNLRSDKDPRCPKLSAFLSVTVVFGNSGHKGTGRED